MNSFPVPIRAVLEAVAYRSWHITIRYAVHVPSIQRKYCISGRVISLIEHVPSGIFYAVDKPTKGLIIADGED